MSLIDRNDNSFISETQCCLYEPFGIWFVTNNNLNGLLMQFYRIDEDLVVSFILGIWYDFYKQTPYLSVHLF